MGSDVSAARATAVSVKQQRVYMEAVEEFVAWALHHRLPLVSDETVDLAVDLFFEAMFLAGETHFLRAECRRTLCATAARLRVAILSELRRRDND